MNIKNVILTMLLSLCAVCVQAQIVDSTHIHSIPDSSTTVASDSLLPTTTSPDNQFSDSSDTTGDTIPSKAIRPRINVSSGKGIKASTSKPVERVNVSDSVLRKKHNPVIAGCLSIIPGGGQIYNKKYWKLPIVYVALGVSSYFVYNYAHQMVQYKKEFINRRDGHIELQNPEYSIYTDENILAMKNTYRRRMEITVAVTAVLYFLNIVDAVVDAHLYYFDISDDLSLRVTPQINQNYTNSLILQQPNCTFNYGLNLTLNFK